MNRYAKPGWPGPRRDVPANGRFLFLTRSKGYDTYCLHLAQSNYLSRSFLSGSRHSLFLFFFVSSFEPHRGDALYSTLPHRSCRPSSTDPRFSSIRLSRWTNRAGRKFQASVRWILRGYFVAGKLTLPPSRW